MEASSKVDLFTAGYVQSHRRCIVYFLSCSYLEQLTSCTTVDSVVHFNVRMLDAALRLVEFQIYKIVMLT